MKMQPSHRIASDTFADTSDKSIMQPPEISKILNDWVDALKYDDIRKRKRISISDLVKKYAEDDPPEIGASL